jgi:hypothetical protein
VMYYTFHHGRTTTPGTPRDRDFHYLFRFGSPKGVAVLTEHVTI